MKALRKQLAQKCNSAANAKYEMLAKTEQGLNAVSTLLKVVTSKRVVDAKLVQAASDISNAGLGFAPLYAVQIHQSTLECRIVDEKWAGVAESFADLNIASNADSVTNLFHKYLQRLLRGAKGVDPDTSKARVKSFSKALHALPEKSLPEAVAEKVKLVHYACTIHESHTSNADDVDYVATTLKQKLEQFEKLVRYFAIGRQILDDFVTAAGELSKSGGVETSASQVDKRMMESFKYEGSLAIEEMRSKVAL